MKCHGRNVLRRRARNAQRAGVGFQLISNQRGPVVLLLIALGCAPDQFVSMGYDVRNQGNGSVDSSGGAIADGGVAHIGGASSQSEIGGTGGDDTPHATGGALGIQSSGNGEGGAASPSTQGSDVRLRVPL